MPKKYNQLSFDANDPKQALYEGYIIAISDGEPDTDLTGESAALDRIFKKHGVGEGYKNRDNFAYLVKDELRAFTPEDENKQNAKNLPTNENVRNFLRAGNILIFPDQYGMPLALSSIRIGDKEYYQCLDVHQATELLTSRENAKLTNGVNFVPPGEPDLLDRICDAFAMLFLGRHGAVMAEWLAYTALDRSRNILGHEALEGPIENGEEAREEARRQELERTEQERLRRVEEERQREETRRRLEEEEQMRRELAREEEKKRFLEEEKKRQEEKKFGIKDNRTTEQKIKDAEIEADLFRDYEIRKGKEELDELLKESREKREKEKQEEEEYLQNDEELFELEEKKREMNNRVEIKKEKEVILDKEQELHKNDLDPYQEKLLGFIQRKGEIEAPLRETYNTKKAMLPEVVEKEMEDKRVAYAKLQQQAASLPAGTSDPELEQKMNRMYHELNWYGTSKEDYLNWRRGLLDAECDARIKEVTEEVDQEMHEFIADYGKNPDKYAFSPEELNARREKNHAIRQVIGENYDKQLNRINYHGRMDFLQEQVDFYNKNRVKKLTEQENERRLEQKKALDEKLNWRKAKPQEFKEVAAMQAQRRDWWQTFAKENNLNPNEPGNTEPLPYPFKDLEKLEQDMARKQAQQNKGGMGVNKK